MNILFRVDAGKKLGLGHYYRSINLALKLKERGHNVVFSFLNSEFWNEVIRNKFEFKTLELNNAKQEQQLLNYIKNYNANFLYVDGNIVFTDTFIKNIKKTGIKIILYQNLTLSRFFADIYIVPSVHHDSAFFEGFRPDTKIYAGLKYFTFNKELAKIKRKILNNSSVKKIAITAGGSDPKNTLKTIFELIDYNDFNDVCFTFYYGQNSKHSPVNQMMKYSNIIISKFDHKKIIENDILISAFGVSTYEFLYLGLPIIAYGHHQSNSIAANFLAEKTKALISLGFIDAISKENLNNAIKRLISDFSDRKKLSNRSKNILDLEGVNRIINIIEKDEKSA